MIDLSDVLAANIQPLSKYMTEGAFRFRTQADAPEGEDYFFLRYRFTLPEDGLYRLVLQGTEPGSYMKSRYSYVVDEGAVRELFYTRIVNGPRHRTEGVEALQLAAGEHTLELRFQPHQSDTILSRVTTESRGHDVLIKAISFEPEFGAPLPPAPKRSANQKLLLKHGDRVVFHGDSITNEEFFPGHVERMIRKAYPGESIMCYNVGIVNNRVWEGWDRIEKDVLPLKPTWVVLNFGVNDCLHVPPEEYVAYMEKMILRIKESGGRVIVTAPTGFLPERDKKRGKFYHTRDRAGAFDRSIAQEARMARELAEKHGCIWADTLSAIQRSGLPRDRLMYNQWHPSREGARLAAVAILQSLGFSQEDAAKSGDGTDLEYFKIVAHIPEIELPRQGVERRVSGDLGVKKLIVAASNTNNAVYAFSLEDGREIARVPVGHRPMGIVWSRKREELYVTCEAVGRVDVIDTRTFEAKEPIAITDIYPIDIVLSADENTAWTANFFGSSISEIDLNERKVKRVILAGIQLECILLLEKHNLLVVGGNQMVLAVDLATGKVVKRVGLNYIGGLIRLSDDEIGAIDTGFWDMHVLSVPDLAVKESKPCILPSRAIAIDPETGDLWAGDWKQGKLVRISKGAAKPEPMGDVEFPFGITIINRTGS